MHACWNLQGLADPLLSKMAKCGKTKLDSHICRNLHTTVRQFKRLLPVKMSTVQTHVRLSKRRIQEVRVAYPVLHLSDWVECNFNLGGHFFTAGLGLDKADQFQQELIDFWKKFTAAEPGFDLPQSQWGESIPLAIHGDEGRGRLKQPVMVMATQTIIPLSSKSPTWLGSLAGNSFCFLLFFYNPKNWSSLLIQFGIKLRSIYLRPSLCTRLLYTILPAPYTSATLGDLLAAWVEDLNKLATDGITVVGQQWIEF